MKKIFFGILLLAFMIPLSACGTKSQEINEDGTSTDDYEITLTYSDHDPPNGMRTKFLREYWFPAIEKETDGKVKINAIFGGGLLTSGEALDGIRDGVTDIGLVYPDNYSERMYTYELFKLFPVATESFDGIYNIFQKSFEQLPVLNEDLEKNNQRVLLLTTGLPIAFGSKPEFDSLEDLERGKWRAASRWHLSVLKNMEANPVSVPWEDVYMSLETGVIDGVMTNFDGFHMMKFYESSENVMVGKELWWAAPFLHTINNDTWESLPTDIQEGILRASEQAQKDFAKIYEKELANAVQEEKDQGANVFYASEEDLALFNDTDLFEELRAIWKDEAINKHNIEEADEYIEKLKNIMNEEIGHDEY